MWSISRYHGVGINICFSMLRKAITPSKLNLIKLTHSFWNPSLVCPKSHVRWKCTYKNNRSSHLLVGKIYGQSSRADLTKEVILNDNLWTSYHDLAITGVEHDKDNKRIIFKVRGAKQIDHELEFSLVEGWELSPFEEQNVLFDIQEYDSQTLPEWIKEDFCLPQKYTQLIQSGIHKLYHIDPAIGMGGYIIAGQLVRSKKQ